MKDFLENDLCVGDSVVIMAPNYRSLTKAQIIAMTSKNIRLAYFNDWNFKPEGKYIEVLQDPKQVVKFAGPEATQWIMDKRK